MVFKLSLLVSDSIKLKWADCVFLFLCPLGSPNRSDLGKGPFHPMWGLVVHMISCTAQWSMRKSRTKNLTFTSLVAYGRSGAVSTSTCSIKGRTLVISGGHDSELLKLIGPLLLIYGVGISFTV